MLGRILLLFGFVYLVHGQQTPALKGWLLGWATDPNLPLMKYGNKSYYMGVNYKATFPQAMQFCDIVYMKLLTIESEDENNFIKKIIIDAKQGSSYWTSGSKILDGKNWVWMSNGQAVEYTNWAPPEPNSAAEKCIQLSNSGSELVWNDLSCDNRINFICQRENSNQTDLVENINFPSVSPNINLLRNNGKVYYFTRGFNGNFLQAAFFCRMIHMTLATINSEEENLAIQQYIRDTNLSPKWWIAGSRFLDNVWTWFTNGQHIEYTKWQKGQPDNVGNNEKCLSILHNKQDGLQWNDFNCNENMPFICERHDEVSNPRINKREVQQVTDESYMEEVREIPSGLISFSYNSGKKFHIQTQLQGTQKQATMFCDYHKLQLVSIDNEHKNDILSRVLADLGIDGPFWTSGIKRYGHWSWGTNKSFSYVNWKSHKTANIHNNCMQILITGKWEDAACTLIRPFICEPKERNQEPQPPKPNKKCSVQPVVNVYINNNLVTDDASSIPALEGHKLEGEYAVDVTNKMSTCN